MERLPKMTINELQNKIQSGQFILYFGADWCPECQAIKPHMPAIEKNFDDYQFLKIDRDENTDLCIALNVRGLPSFIGYHDGQEVGRFVNGDLKTQTEVETWIRGLA